MGKDLIYKQKFYALMLLLFCLSVVVLFFYIHFFLGVFFSLIYGYFALMLIRFLFDN